MENNLYKLTKKDNDEYFRIFLQADSNDADYVATETILSKEEFEGVAIHELRVLNAFYSKEYKFSGFHSDVIDVPYTDWGTCHTLNSLSIEYVNNGEIYDVEINEFTEEEKLAINENYEDYEAYLNDITSDYFATIQGE